MKRIIGLFFCFLPWISSLWAQEQKSDTARTDTTLQGVKMKEVVVTKDKRLPIFVSPDTKDMGPRVPTLSDIIGKKATDLIMHPFAFRSRKEERRRKKAMKKLWEYDQIVDYNELLREALRREGIDPDSLLRASKGE